MKSSILTLSLCLLTSTAFAEGVLLAPSHLLADERAALAEQIRAARADNPAPFEALARLRQRLPELDANKRGGLVPLSRQIASMRRNGVLPALEMIAFSAPSSDGLTESARLSLSLGLLEGLEQVADPRTEGVLTALLNTRPQDARVVRAAAAALGALQSDSAARTLLKLFEGAEDRAFKSALAAGMGSCKRAIVARALGIYSASELTESEAKAVAESLGRVGARTSWTYGRGLAKAEEREVRSAAAKALLALYIAREGDVRREASDALMVVDYPETPSLIDAQLRSVDSPAQREAMAQLSARFRDNPVR